MSPLRRVRTPEFRDFPRPHSQEGAAGLTCQCPASQGRRRCLSVLACSLGAGVLSSYSRTPHNTAVSRRDYKVQTTDSPTRAAPLYTVTGTPDMFNKYPCVNSKTKQSKNQPSRFFYWFLYVAIALETGTRSGNKTKIHAPRNNLL